MSQTQSPNPLLLLPSIGASRPSHPRRRATAADTIMPDDARRAYHHAPLSLVERWTVHASNSQLNAVSGALGGFASGITTCPLDVIKTKLQAQGTYAQRGQPKMYNGLVGTARVILTHEGVRGLYRGLGPIVVGYLPTWAVWFPTYNNSKLFLENYTDNKHAINFISSIVAGALSTTVTNPIWVVKTRLMSQSVLYHPASYSRAAQSGLLYTSALDAVRKMYRCEGIRAFYSGLTPALLGLSHVAVQFPTYEYLRLRFTGRGLGDAPAEGEKGQSQWLGILSASIISKIVASSATYPHEVLRTRLQTQRRLLPTTEAATTSTTSTGSAGATVQTTARYRGIVRTVRIILREEGWRAFYAGLGTNLTRAVPAATVTMLTYEFVMANLVQAQRDGLRKLGTC